MRITIGLLALFLIGMTSCKQSTSPSIEGTILNTTETKAFLAKKNLNSTLESITDVAMNKGKFEFKFEEPLEAGMYRIRIGSRGVDLVLNGTEGAISISGDFNDLNKYNYSITGSELSEKYRSGFSSVINRESSVEELIKSTTSGDPLLGTALKMNMSPINPSEHALYTNLAQRLAKDYPNSPLASNMEDIATKSKKQYERELNKYPVKIGQPAPDIALQDPNGVEMKLSDLKGKVVLLDFWASWCGPCRRANPHVVDVYNRYKDEGFTVYSVSLDGLDARTKSRLKGSEAVSQRMVKEKQKWKDAIIADNLVWDTHVSELKKWDTKVTQDYGVRSIPTTFLIDRDGNIAALNPRNNLEEQVKKFI
jgi:thiol-disulfide isomerase/thioredoxin